MTIKPAYTKCPKCETIYSYQEETENKDTPLEIWTDGFELSPSRKELIKFAQCPGCETYFWLKENAIEEPQGSENVKAIDNSWSFDNVGKKELDITKDTLQKGLASSLKKEIYLRTKLWQVINHLSRKYEGQGFFKNLFKTTEHKDSLKLYKLNSTLKMNNLIRLANLLKKDKKKAEDHMLFAEIYREMGDFSKAMFYCHKADTAHQSELKRINKLMLYIKSKDKEAYKL